ncbi:MAG: c-type cytochrome [Oleiphilaceae bacterium]|nr:c-type cytochrome [Oleiphilaceae bacterium]
MKNLMRVLAGLAASLLVVIAAHAAMDNKSIENRIKPVGKVCVEGDDCGAASAAADAGPKSPEDIYQASCFGCHGTGALNAPKFGDAAAWTARLDKGMDQLVANAINGINAMPPKGTCGSCSDDDIKATVQYILDNSK